jgi:hypothetical protein
VTYKAVLFLALSLLSGCATYQWNKDGATQADFNQDSYQCMTEAARTYPTAVVTQQVTQGYNTAAQTNCYTNGNAYGTGSYVYGSSDTSCTTTGGQYVPPTYVNVDANTNNRAQYQRQCMFAHGYQIVRVCNSSHCLN